MPPATRADAGPVLPRDARLIALILAAAGAEDWYTSDILTDSLMYAEHARSGSASTAPLVPSLEDVRLAVQARTEGAQVPKEFLLQLATTVNSVPLPPVPEVYGIRLPPPAQRLTAPNYTLVPREGGAPAPAPPPLSLPAAEELTTAAAAGGEDVVGRSDLADLGGAIFRGGGAAAGAGAGGPGGGGTTRGSGDVDVSGTGTGLQTAEGSEAEGSTAGGLFGDDDDDEEDEEEDDNNEEEEDDDEEMEDVTNGLSGGESGRANGAAGTKRKAEDDDEYD